MAEEVNVHEQFVLKVMDGVDVSKPESVKAANDVIRTYNDLKVEEAKLQQNERSLDIQEKKLSQEEAELKQKKIDMFVTNGVAVGTSLLSVGMIFKWMKFTEAGNAVTSTLGKTVMNSFKLFSKLK